MIAAIIPARGGSKRIHKKNIKEFVGKPIIAYSIEAALNSKIFDRVIITTDSVEIADIAKQYGAEVPFFRPKELSDDRTPTAPVIAHAVNYLREEGDFPEYVCCIYATAPFLQPEYLVQGLQEIRQHQCATCYSVTTFPFPILRALKISGTGYLEMFWPEYEMTRSQDLPEAYHDAGQFYWVDCEKFMETPKLYSKNSRPIQLPRHLVQDIDTLEDWTRAEYMYKALQLTNEIIIE